MHASQMGRVTSVVALAVGIALAASCRPTAPPRRAPSTRAEDARLARGSALYAGYCGGCHGADGRSSGPVARTLRMQPTDLRTPGLLVGVSDAEIAARVLHGDALRTAPHGSAFGTEREVTALEEFIRTIDTHPWERVRAGRVIYENACAACHGAYGTSEGVLGALLARTPANLQTAMSHYTDAALAGVIRQGLGGMPPMGDLLTESEMHALVAHLRVLSPEYRLYDTYCASCHGDDGRGVDAEDALAPAVVGPALDPARLAQLKPDARRAKVLHMFERERGLMPHFRGTLDEARFADILAYLRATMP
jgi:mono/diheme cytochrome c family protein